MSLFANPLLLVLLFGCPLPSGPQFYKYQGRQWETGMFQSCTANPLGWFLGCFCGPCMAYHLREKALQSDWSRYSCCQGYVCNTCADCVPAQDSCPKFCMCLECCFCYSCAISATRIYVQDERRIQTDPCDNRIM